METKQILAIMKVASWIIFIGLSIKVGAIIIASFVSLFVNIEAAKDIYSGLNLASVYNLGSWHYVSVLSLIISMAALKAQMFYVVIKIFSKINLENPFNFSVQELILKISYVALSIGIISKIAGIYFKRLVTHEGVSNIAIDTGSNDYFFMAGILFIIAYIFKRGVEIQSENELTV